MFLITFPQEMILITGITDDIDVDFMGLYGPPTWRQLGPVFLVNTPDRIWNWYSALARARVHMQARTRRNSD